MTETQTVAASCLWGCSENLGKPFWQQWQQYRDYLYRCCIKWMDGNLTDAEDALSRVMIKAWEKVQKYAGEIANFKAWLTRLTHNLCVDIHRERSRSANRVEDIEVYTYKEEQGLVQSDDTPENAMDTGEKRNVIRHAIDNLPARLRETFILHFDQELSYPEIAQQQQISYQNVCKRISHARAILRLELMGYFMGEDEADTDKSFTPTPAATESEIGEKSKGNAGVEPIEGETVTLSIVVEEVKSVVGGEAQEVALSVQRFESAMVASPSDCNTTWVLGKGKREKEEIQLVSPFSFQLSPNRLQVYDAYPSSIASDGKLKVNTDGYCCVEAALCERQPAPILALAQFDEETASWGNPRLAVFLIQQQPLVGKEWGVFLLPSRSPPLSRLPYFQFLVKRLSRLMIKLRFF